jgi:hypothetical protein
MTLDPRTVGRIAVQLVLTALVGVVLGFGLTVNGFNERPSFHNAFQQYRANPTGENERVFLEEQRLVYRDRHWVMAAIAVVVCVVLNAGIVLARRKLPGVIREETIGACAAWMVLFGMAGSAGTTTIGHWRAGGKIVHGSTTNSELCTAVGMTIGLLLGMIPAMGRWWKQRRDPSTVAPSSADSGRLRSG